MSRDAYCDPRRDSTLSHLTAEQALATLVPGKALPEKVLKHLIGEHNHRHTALAKVVSHKTRFERAHFLRRFFRDLKLRAGFKRIPDPRNLDQRHIRAMVEVWKADGLSAATIQTYLSFLRGLSAWIGKAGLVMGPAYYGLDEESYQRHEVASQDKSWTPKGIPVDSLLEEITASDPWVGASLRLIRALGLRRKESIIFRPYENVASFPDTGLDPSERQADVYAKIVGKGGRLRWIPLNSESRMAVVRHAQETVGSRDAHMGNPALDLRANLQRFNYVLRKFGVSRRVLGVTAHGLRHEVMNDTYHDTSGHPSPVQGGGPVCAEDDLRARRAVSALAGHHRQRAAAAYIGARPRSFATDTPSTESDDDETASAESDVKADIKAS
jgi:site-specific recombinase XerC